MLEMHGDTYVIRYDILALYFIGLITKIQILIHLITVSTHLHLKTIFQLNKHFTLISQIWNKVIADLYPRAKIQLIQLRNVIKNSLQKIT